MVTVPQGCYAGSQIQVQVPGAAPAPAPAPEAPPSAPTAAAMQPYTPPATKQYTYSNGRGTYYNDNEHLQAGFGGQGAYHS